MTRQNLYLREVAIALDELSGKNTVRKIRDHLKEQGLLAFGDGDQERWELEKTRKLIQQSRRFDNKDDTGKVDLINLFEIAEDGSKVEYYRKAEECTLEEAVQHLEYWNKTRLTADKHLRYYYKVFGKIHGRRKIQRKLSFALTVAPERARKASKVGV